MTVRGRIIEMNRTILCIFLFQLLSAVILHAEHIEFTGFGEDTTHWSTDTVFITGNHMAMMGEYASGAKLGISFFLFPFKAFF